MTDFPSYGRFIDPDGELRLRRIPISYVDALPSSGDFPGHIFWLKAGTIGLYVWDGSSFVGPLGTGGGGGGGAPTGAQYIVGALDGTLTAERLVTDTATVAWDLGTAGQAKANVPDGSISNSKIRVAAARSVIGHASSVGGQVADIVAAVDGDVLRRSGATLGFGAVAQASVTNLVSDLAARVLTTRAINTTAPIAGGGDLSADRTLSLNDDGVTNAKLRNSSALSVIGRSTNSVGDPADIVAGVDGHVLRQDSGNLAFGFITTINIANSAITTALVGNNQITNAKLADMTDLRIKGRNAGSAGAPQDLTAAQVLGILGLSVPTGTGFTHITSGVQDAAAKLVDTADVNDNQITDAKLRDSAALSVIGRSANTTGDPADIAAGTDGHALRRSGTTLAFGQLTTAGLADEAVTYAKLQHCTRFKLLGRKSTPDPGDVEEVGVAGSFGFSAGGDLTVLPHSQPAIFVTQSGGLFGEWKNPANYPAYPLFKDSSSNVSFPKVYDSTTVSMPSNPVSGQHYYHKDHKCWYVFDSVANGWLSSHIYELWFGTGNADVAATAYLKFQEVNTFSTFTDTLGHIIGADVKVVGLTFVMASTHTANTTIEVFDDGAAATSSSLTMTANTDTRKADETLMGGTILANSVIGVKVTAGTAKQPGRGCIRLRRFIAA